MAHPKCDVDPNPKSFLIASHMIFVYTTKKIKRKSTLKFLQNIANIYTFKSTFQTHLSFLPCVIALSTRQNDRHSSEIHLN